MEGHQCDASPFVPRHSICIKLWSARRLPAGCRRSIRRDERLAIGRSRAGGTLAELLGPAALPGDVELRTIGIRCAAEGSLAVISGPWRTIAQAYAEGVNACVATLTRLPPEHQALEVTRSTTTR